MSEPFFHAGVGSRKYIPTSDFGVPVGRDTTRAKEKMLDEGSTDRSKSLTIPSNGSTPHFS